MENAQSNPGSQMARLGAGRYVPARDYQKRNNAKRFGMYYQKQQGSLDYRKELNKWVMVK
jgi:hypothetical protein